MKNKLTKLLLTSAALLAGAVSLTSCDDDIEASPEGYDSIKLINDDNCELTNNQLQVIYDALVSSGSSNSEKVLTNLLKLLSKQYFGSFYTEGTVVGLHDAATDSAKMTTFLTDSSYGHKIYNKNFDGKEDVATAKDRVTAYYNYLLKQINKEFISIAKNTTYQDGRHTFKEEEWVKATKNSGYKLTLTSGKSYKEVKVNGNDDEENVLNYFHDTYLEDYKDYIERSILPSLYQKKLVEYYIMNNNAGVLGRTYARKVNYVKVADNANFPGKMKDLVSAYAEKVLKVKDNANDADFDFDFLSDLVKGTITPEDDPAKKLNKMAYDIYQAAGLTTSVTAGGHTSIEGTTLGEALKEYNKIDENNRFLNNQEAYNKYTNNGAYKKEVGLQIEVDKIKATSTTAVEGWYTSSTLSDLPSELSDRLFKVGVALDIDDSTKTEEVSYGKRVQGNYYITPKTVEKTNETPYVYNTNGSTYIVKVEEAVNVPKLKSTDNNNTYSYDLVSGKNREEIAYEVAHLVSDNDTYAKTAKQYWIEKANLSFHDDYVYDYFAEQFPDLFEAND